MNRDRVDRQAKYGGASLGVFSWVLLVVLVGCGAERGAESTLVDTAGETGSEVEREVESEIVSGGLDEVTGRHLPGQETLLRKSASTRSATGIAPPSRPKTTFDRPQLTREEAAAVVLPEPAAVAGTLETVRVYFATDRNRTDVLTWRSLMVPRLVIASLTVIIALLVVMVRPLRHIRATWYGLAALAFTAAIAILMLDFPESSGGHAASELQHFGNDRGDLSLGICDVTIPKVHQAGIVEKPSIIRLEFAEDPERHVVLQSVVPMSTDSFYDNLRERVRQAPAADLFVFIHGYNVTFPDAIKRTAQLSHDLKYQGAAVCFSWPSQGGLLRYTIDENNVVWSTPHLKQFLVALVERTGARSVNLIAHSMGNRALSEAVKQIEYDGLSHRQGQLPRFNQVVMAAPDIDAEIFRRDVAPLICRMANRVTLYASARDRALLASKKVHGYPRAGDSAEGLVVVEGVETIDVSQIDTSLIGHSYYGSSRPLLDDLHEVVLKSFSASQRPWLQPATWGNLGYWRLTSNAATAGRTTDGRR
ncbi:MAG: alpha/beta hydrolase [Pirellulaceae bacterium]